MQNYFFKIVTDLQNSKEVVEEAGKNQSIISVYLYTSIKERGGEIFELKRESRKVKGAFFTLNEAANQVS